MSRENEENKENIYSQSLGNRKNEIEVEKEKLKKELTKVQEYSEDLAKKEGTLRMLDDIKREEKRRNKLEEFSRNPGMMDVPVGGPARFVTQYRIPPNIRQIRLEDYNPYNPNEVKHNVIKDYGIGLLGKGEETDWDVYDTGFKGGIIRKARKTRKTRRKKRTRKARKTRR